MIICVDDEPIVLGSLKRQLLAGLGSDYAVETAESAAEALEVIDELMEEGTELPLVISDHLMPEMRGAEPFDANVYGWLLVLSMGSLVCAAVALTVRQVRRRHSFRERLLEVDGGLDAVSRVGLGLERGVKHQQLSSQDVAE